MSSTPSSSSYNLYNLTLPDQSPLLYYSPFRDGPSTSGWNSSYTQSNYWAHETIAQGTSYHTTSLVGASVWHTFIGTGAWVYGNGDVNITCDGEPANVDDDGTGDDDGLLGGCEGWKKGNHTVQVVVNSGEVDIYAIKTEVAFGLPGAYVTNMTIPAITGSVDVNKPFMDRNGSWEIGTNFGGGGGSTTIIYNRLATSSAGSGLVFNLTLGTSLFLLYGSVNYNHGVYGVTLDAGDMEIFYGESMWASVDQVLYYRTIDPKKQHYVTITNAPDSETSSYWDLNSVVEIQASGGEAVDDGNVGSTGMSPGALAGAIIGAVLGALLIFGGLFLLYKRRRRQQRERNDEKEVTSFHVRRGSERWAGGLQQTTSAGSETEMLDATGSTAITPSDTADPFRDRPGVAQRGSHEIATPFPRTPSLHRPSPSILPLAPPISTSMIITNPDTVSSPTTPSQSTLDLALPIPNNTNVNNTDEKSGPSRAPTRRPLPEPRVRQEQDGGRVDHAHRQVQEEVVPPRYDPSWAVPSDSVTRT